MQDNLVDQPLTGIVQATGKRRYHPIKEKQSQSAARSSHEGVLLNRTIHEDRESRRGELQGFRLLLLLLAKGPSKTPATRNSKRRKRRRKGVEKKDGREERRLKKKQDRRQEKEKKRAEMKH